MSLIRTIGFTVCFTALTAIIMTNSVIRLPSTLEFLIFAIVGAAIYFIFGPEEHLSYASLVFITAAVVLIITGFLGNAAVQIAEAMMGRAIETGARTFQIATVLGSRNVLLGLISLFIGIFAPSVALIKFKDKQPIDYGTLLRSAISAGVIYIIALLIYKLAMSHVIDGVGVLTG
jgi:hypothetical protein